MKPESLVLPALAVLLVACATVGPPAPSSPPVGAGFSHADFEAFLRRHVDEEGRLDYAAVASDRTDLDRYLTQLAGVSPDSDPERFPTDRDRLAYWLNAYNASVISLVLAHYPIASVMDVRPPLPFRFLPSGAGFFVFHRVMLGGRRVTLYGLEHRIIRRRFQDPRIHFALNCASRGCPRLPATAFSSTALEKQLESESRSFVADEQNARVDAQARTLYLSSIFDWFEEDFTHWLAEHRPGVKRSLRSYVLLYASESKGASIRECSDCRLAFVPYDWALNDQRERRSESAMDRRDETASRPSANR